MNKMNNKNEKQEFCVLSTLTNAIKEWKDVYLTQTFSYSSNDNRVILSVKYSTIMM